VHYRRDLFVAMGADRPVHDALVNSRLHHNEVLPAARGIQFTPPVPYAMSAEQFPGCILDTIIKGAPCRRPL
jgi:hypothetical protein